MWIVASQCGELPRSPWCRVSVRYQDHLFRAIATRPGGSDGRVRGDPRIMDRKSWRVDGNVPKGMMFHVKPVSCCFETQSSSRSLGVSG